MSDKQYFIFIFLTDSTRANTVLKTWEKISRRAPRSLKQEQSLRPGCAAFTTRSTPSWTSRFSTAAKFTRGGGTDGKTVHATHLHDDTFLLELHLRQCSMKQVLLCVWFRTRLPYFILQKPKSDQIASLYQHYVQSFANLLLVICQYIFIHWQDFSFSLVKVF